MIYYKNILIIFLLFCGASGHASSFEEVSKSTATIVHDNGLGSGFFISKNLLVTNYHVVQDAKNGIIFLVTQQGTKDAGLVIAVDSRNDLAIIKTVKNNFKALRMGNSQNVKMGDEIFVIGSPEGFTGTLSKGILSAKRDDNILQITAPISSGSSGSPVFSKNFEVIGIATLTHTKGQNLNFAVSVNKLKDLVRKNKITLNQKANLQKKVAQSKNNFSKSFQFYTKKKNKTSKDMFKIGSMYNYGSGVEENDKKAFYWYRKAANQGHIEAQIWLGLMYLRGYGVKKNNKKAFYWYQKTATAKEGKSDIQTNAQFRLGDMYYSGEGVKRNYKKALYWYRKSAHQGGAVAQLRLGVMYDNGEGVKRNYKKALYWYEKSVQQDGILVDYSYLGDMYYDGKEGVKKDYKKAFYWYEKSVQQGDASAQYNLALMYDKGEGVTKNYIQAYKWLTLAKAQMTDKYKDQEVDKLLNELENKMTKDQIEEAQKLASQFK